MIKNKDNLLNTFLAARMTGFSPSYIRRLISKGKIKAVKIGYDWFMTPEDLQHIGRQRKSRDPS